MKGYHREPGLGKAENGPPLAVFRVQILAAVPGAGHGGVQMRIVCENGLSGGGQVAVEGPGVGALRLVEAGDVEVVVAAAVQVLVGARFRALPQALQVEERLVLNFEYLEVF